MRHINFKWLAKAAFFGTVAVVVFVGGTMLLWNHLAAPIFGLPLLSFLQTAGLMLLGRLLTGGFGGRGKGWRRGHHWRERWQGMTPEQREQAMQRWGKRGFGPMGAPSEGPTAEA